MTILVFDSFAGKILNLHGLSRGAFFITKRETRHVQKNWPGKEYITHVKLCERTCNFVISFWIFFKKETFLSTNFLNLCPRRLTELCLAKSLIHLSKRIWANIDKMILECVYQCMLNIGDLKIVNCTEIFIYRRQMLPQEPPIKQDLQQTHTKTQLLMHAKHESHHRIT